MREHFDRAVEFVLQREGGYVNDPKDPGGETKYGISRRSYPDEDIQELTKERAIEIYHRDFWTACQCDELPVQVAVLVFDAAVNQGPAAAVKMLQEEVQTKPDGILGPVTLGAVKTRDPDDMACRYAARRGHRYAVTKNSEHYLFGWMLRLLDCYRLALVVG